ADCTCPGLFVRLMLVFVTVNVCGDPRDAFVTVTVPPVCTVTVDGEKKKSFWVTSRGPCGGGLVRVGLGLGECDGEGDGRGDGVGDGLGEGLGDGLGLGEGEGDGDGDGEELGLGLGEGDGDGDGDGE